MATEVDYRYVNLSIRSIFDMMIGGFIDRDPSYQREIVWKRQQQVGLICTLLDGYPIPSVSLVTTDVKGSKRECLDGKNRLESLYLYMSNNLEVRGHRYEDLDISAKMWFGNIQIQTVIFGRLAEDDKRHYFRCIQEGVNLSKTEQIWSEDRLPFVFNLRRVRERRLRDIQEFAETKRYSDFTILCNIAAMIIGAKNIEKATAGHSTALTAWVRRQQMKDSEAQDIMGVLDVILTRLHAVLSVHRTPDKVRVSVTLDLARYIVYKLHRDQTADLDRMRSFVQAINDCLAGVVPDECPPHLAEYVSVILRDTASKTYTRKSFEQRFNLIRVSIDLL